MRFLNHAPMIRILLLAGLAWSWPGCDSGGPARTVDDDRPEMYKITYRVDGDVVQANSISYLDASADTVVTESPRVPFLHSTTFEDGQTAHLSVVATPFNPLQAEPNKEVTVIASILVDDVLVRAETRTGSRLTKLRPEVRFVLPR